MRFLSGLIRVLAGLGVMAMAAYVYFANQQQLDGRTEVVLSFAGQEIATTPGQMYVVMGMAAAVGALMVVLGIATMVRRPRPVPAPESAPVA